MEIKSITSLKYRDKNNNNKLRDSSAIKIEFVSNLLLEFISILSVKVKVRLFINRVKKCYNYLRWSYSSLFVGEPQCVSVVEFYTIRKAVLIRLPYIK